MEMILKRWKKIMKCQVFCAYLKIMDRGRTCDLVVVRMMSGKKSFNMVSPSQMSDGEREERIKGKEVLKRRRGDVIHMLGACKHHYI